MGDYRTRTNPEISEREKRNLERSRSIAAQGMVLLENKGALPFKRDLEKIALYGNGARRTVKGGTGSGDVNSRFSINVEQGLEDAGYSITTKPWLERYDRLVEQARAEYFGEIRQALATEGTTAIMRLFNEPFLEPPVPLVTQEDMERSDTDTAVYVIARNSGEGKDRRQSQGQYELYDMEMIALKALADYYKNVIVVLNVGGVIDTKFLRHEEGIGAVLLMGQAGNIGGYALADVLTGKVSPSGKLTATWAENYGDYPGAETYGHRNGNVDDEYYTENIYVGYRYFDSFNVTPAYPFGYGKSYTAFRIQAEETEVRDGEVWLHIEVENTGNIYAGREVVQIYYSAPEGRMDKPYQELATYAKTKELKPGEKECLILHYPVSTMASYDETSAAWILEAGDYVLRVGADSRNTHVAAVLELKGQVTAEQLANRMALDCELELLRPSGKKAYGYEEESREIETAPRIILHAEDVLSEKTGYGIPSRHPEETARGENLTLEEFLDQLTVEQMAELCVGTARDGLGSESVIGSASMECPGAAGETASIVVKDERIKPLILADGPAGLRLNRSFMIDKEDRIIPGTSEAPIPGMELLMGDMPKAAIPENAVTCYQYCTAVPIASLLAQTWDMALLEEAGDIVGEEMNEFGVNLWLAPAMNIQRNPLCGRNFEYYSEDPLVSGLCAASVTQGVQKHPKAGTTIKHFACNNQEDNRMHTNAHVSERALREIYLKGYEIAVKQAQPMAIMTSYNLLNGVHTANHYDLLTAVAREEWGFQGIFMTDWGTTGGMEMEPGKIFKYPPSDAAACVKAGNDLIMPGSQKDVDTIRETVGGRISIEELRTCARRIISTVIRCS